MTASIAERVAAGAAWLDENRPGWVEHIDLDRLDLSSECSCVLGQEFGDYPVAGIPDEDAIPLGFYAHADLYSSYQEDVDDEYAALTAEWRRLITARRVLTS